MDDHQAAGMSLGFERRRHIGPNENLVEPLHYGSGGARVPFGSRHGSGYGVFQDFKHKIAASMRKDEPWRRKSPTLQGDAKNSLRNRTQSAVVGHPNERIRTSTNSDPARFFGASSLSDDMASQGCSRASPSPHMKKPRGPRALPTDRIMLKSDPGHSQAIRHSEEFALPQTSTEPLQNSQATRCPITEIRRSKPTAPSYRGSSGMGCDTSHLFDKEDESTVGLTRPCGILNKSRLHQSSKSDGHAGYSQQQAGMKIVENINLTATVEADAATDHASTNDLMRTKSVLRMLDGLKVVIFRVDRKLPNLAVLSDLGIWRRVMEMILHVFSTLHHASPALQVLRSTNARPSEYGKALRDFCRAIVYLLVLLSLLQLVAHAVRIVFMVLNALAWPIRLMWFVLSWVAAG